MNNRKRCNAKRNFIAVFGSLLLLSGCHNLQGSNQEISNAYADNYEISGTTRDDIIGTVSPAIYTTVDRSNKEAKRKYGPVSSKKGVKLSLETGRYIITGHPTGRVFIYDEDGNLLVQEIVGDKVGVPALTADIDSSFSVVMDGGYDIVTIEPVKTKLSTELAPGIWDVGLDIAPGHYTISTPYGYGFVQIFEQGEEPRLFELTAGELTNSQSRVQLKEGQKVRVSKVSIVNFERASEADGDEE